MSRALVALLLIGFAAGAPARAATPRPHHDLTVHLDPGTREAAITDTVRLQGSGPIVFYLGDVFRMTGLAVDGRPVEPAHDGDRWPVDLGIPGDHVVTFSYHGRLDPVPGHSGAMGPGRAVAGPEGSFLPAFAGWYPVPDDRLFGYRVTVDVPLPQKAVVPGRLVDERQAHGRYRAVFESEAPSDGIALMAGPFVVQERRHGAIRLRTYFHREIADLAAGYLDFAGGYIDRYSKAIGAYPFSGFDVVSSPLPVGLGYPGLTYIGTRVLRLPFIRYTSFGHEILHNWWGNGVYPDYGTGNWAEGLTTFMADYAYAADRSAEEARRKRLGWLRDFAALPADRDRPAVDFVSRRHQAEQIVGYDKVAFFFYMLRDELGHAAFRAGLRRFWRTWKFRIAGWPELRRAFEAESGRELGGFFDQWLRRVGAPRLVLGPVAVTALPDGRSRVSFTLSQDAPPYALTVPVRLTTDAEIQWTKVALRGAEVHVSVTARGHPLALAVDPDFDLFRHLAPAEAPPILRDVTLDAATRIVVLTGDDRERSTARRLAERLVDSPPRFATPDPRHLPAAPLLVIGTSGRVTAFLKAAGLPAPPTTLRGRGTAHVWAARRNARQPILVVTANDAAALEALLRPLPHYGGYGYLVFEGAKAVDRGTWPAGPGPLNVRLDRKAVVQ